MLDAVTPPPVQTAPSVHIFNFTLRFPPSWPPLPAHSIPPTLPDPGDPGDPGDTGIFLRSNRISSTRFRKKSPQIFFEKRKKTDDGNNRASTFHLACVRKKKFWNDKVTQSRSNKYRGNEPRRHRRCASAGSTRPRSSPARVSPVSRPCLARVSPRLSPRRFLTYLEPFPVD